MQIIRKHLTLIVCREIAPDGLKHRLSLSKGVPPMLPKRDLPSATLRFAYNFLEGSDKALLFGDQSATFTGLHWHLKEILTERLSDGLRIAAAESFPASR